MSFEASRRGAKLAAAEEQLAISACFAPLREVLPAITTTECIATERMPIQRRVEFLRLVAGRYEPVPLENYRIFRTAVIPGFWLDVDWLLAKELPRGYVCLEKILASARKRGKRRR